MLPSCAPRFTSRIHWRHRLYVLRHGHQDHRCYQPVVSCVPSECHVANLPRWARPFFFVSPVQNRDSHHCPQCHLWPTSSIWSSFVGHRNAEKKCDWPIRPPGLGMLQYFFDNGVLFFVRLLYCVNNVTILLRYLGFVRVNDVAVLLRIMFQCYFDIGALCFRILQYYFDFIFCACECYNVTIT